ncbi:hypothetical protein [Gloeobacter violaceus]|nr:hypothetical protein [Gloeobacter violaceus]
MRTVYTLVFVLAGALLVPVTASAQITTTPGATNAAGTTTTTGTTTSTTAALFINSTVSTAPPVYAGPVQPGPTYNGLSSSGVYNSNGTIVPGTNALSNGVYSGLPAPTPNFNFTATSGGTLAPTNAQGTTQPTR